MGLLELRRVTDLFVEGTEVVLKDDPEDPVLIWVNKLNPFEKQDCVRAGSVARGRLMLAMEEVGTPEYTLFESSLHERPMEDIRQALVGAQSNEFIVKAIEDMNADPEWAERIEIIRHAAQVDSFAPDDPEREVVERTNRDYANAVQALVKSYREDAEQEARALSDREVRERFRKSWIEQRSTGAFEVVWNQHQIFYALRTCKAVKRDLGDYDHSECTHERALADPEDVTKLPAGLIERVLKVINDLSMARDDARFSDGPLSSSASSQRPAPGVASTASTPEAMSPVPAGTFA